MRRDAAQAGDDIWISGTLGDARLALACYWTHWVVSGPELKQAGRRMHMPTPRVQLGRALAAGRLAHAAIDVSDGLIGDLGHILAASKVGATLNVDALPAGEILAEQPQRLRRQFCVAGGDDYELCFTAPREQRAAIEAAASAADTRVTRVGSIGLDPGLRLVDAAGGAVDLQLKGFDHFAAG